MKPGRRAHAAAAHVRCTPRVAVAFARCTAPHAPLTASLFAHAAPCLAPPLPRARFLNLRTAAAHAPRPTPRASAERAPYPMPRARRCTRSPLNTRLPPRRPDPRKRTPRKYIPQRPHSSPVPQPRVSSRCSRPPSGSGTARRTAPCTGRPICVSARRGCRARRSCRRA